MVFAELSYQGHYSDYHDAIVNCLLSEFPGLQQGHQGDSWIRIGEEADKVTIDTFYSMKHQVKAADPENPLLRLVLDQLQTVFEVTLFDPPFAEPHED